MSYNELKVFKGYKSSEKYIGYGSTAFNVYSTYGKYKYGDNCDFTECIITGEKYFLNNDFEGNIFYDSREKLMTKNMISKEIKECKNDLVYMENTDERYNIYIEKINFLLFEQKRLFGISEDNIVHNKSRENEKYKLPFDLECGIILVICIYLMIASLIFYQWYLAWILLIYSYVKWYKNRK